MDDEEVGPVAAELEGHLQELAALMQEEQDMQRYAGEVFSNEFLMIKRLEGNIKREKDTIEDLKVQIAESKPELADQLGQARREIDSKRTDIKKLCHNLPLSTLRKGLAVRGSNLRVSVSKATVRTTYRSVEMIKAHPKLLEMGADGDPLVTPTVDASILSRLIAEGEFDEEEAAKFRVETKLKNPQVRITEEEEQS